MRPAPSPPARRVGTNTAPPAPRARPSSPALLLRIGGGADGWGGIQGRYQGGPSTDSWTQAGGHRSDTLGWPLAVWVSAEVGYWLRGPQPGWLLGAWGREDVLRGQDTFPHPRPSGAGASEYTGPRSSGSSPRNSQHFAELSRRPTSTSHLFAREGRPFPHPFNTLLRERAFPANGATAASSVAVNQAPRATGNLFLKWIKQISCHPESRGGY